MQMIRKTPLAVSGLALGLAALGVLVKPLSELSWLACGVLATLLVLMVLARLALDTQAVVSEASTPVAHSTLPALFMAVTLLSTYLAPFAKGVAVSIWWIALVAQVAISVMFIVRYLPKFDLKSVLPSWFLVFVGFVVSAVTSPVFELQQVGVALFWAGLVGYIAILPAVVARLVKFGELPAPAAPLIAITTAPPALLIAGYLSTAVAPAGWLVIALLAMWVVSFTFVLVKAPGILRMGFLPTMGALTFPVVISATALTKAAKMFADTGLMGDALAALAPVVTALAAVVVGYVGVRYTIFLMKLGKA